MPTRMSVSAALELGSACLDYTPFGRSRRPSYWPTSGYCVGETATKTRRRHIAFFLALRRWPLDISSQLRRSDPSAFLPGARNAFPWIAFLHFPHRS